ncbi:reverse transcriptase domain-containing protein [Tanacetum coccineum]
MDKVQKSGSESTAQVPPPEDQDSIFIEIPIPRAKKTVQGPVSPDPNSYQPKLPYPERMKVREKDTPSAQQSRFMKLFKQLRLEIGLKDALIEMPKFNKWLSSLLRNKEKLEEIAINTVNAKCSAIILNKVSEKLEDLEKFLIPCALQELDRTNAFADSGASINLLPHYIYKQLVLGALKPTRMTLELANRSVTHTMGIAKDVVVRVDVGSNELVFYADKSEKSKNKQFAHAISVIDFLKDEPFSDSTTNHSDALPPSSSPVKTSDNLEEFADELTLLKKEDNIDEIDAFLAMKVSSNFKEGYYDSEGEIIFLENLLSDDTAHNLAPEENVHTNPSSIIESLPISLIPVEDNDPVQEEIDIFLIPDDLIPPGVENDDSEDEDNSIFLPENESSILEPSSPSPSPNHRCLLKF